MVVTFYTFKGYLCFCVLFCLVHLPLIFATELLREGVEYFIWLIVIVLFAFLYLVYYLSVFHLVCV